MTQQTAFTCELGVEAGISGFLPFMVGDGRRPFVWLSTPLGGALGPLVLSAEE
jgi:hypothetical protein